jgi:uncharacterized protein (TIGR02271 family)
MSETYSSTASASSGTLTAFFDSRTDAQEAADRLRDIGIPDGSIRVVGDETRVSGETYERSDADKGFWENLSDFFFPDEDRATYAEGLRRGGTLLTVSNIPTALYDQTLDILDDEGSIDIDTRAESWRSEGWSSAGYGSAGASAASSAAYADREVSDATTGSLSAGSGAAARAAGYGSATDTSETLGSAARAEALRSDRDEDVIPVVEEQLRVGKRGVNLGRVRVRSYVVEEPVNESVNLRDERVVVERRPVDRTLSGTEANFTDRVIEAEEHAEEAVISKEARVKEEIALRREAEERTETVSDTVRRTEVEIEDERLEAERLASERRTATDKL